MNLKGYQFPKYIILETVCYYLVYKLSYRDIDYRAVDKHGVVIDYYLSPSRDETTTKVYINKAIALNGLPEKVVADVVRPHECLAFQHLAKTST